MFIQNKISISTLIGASEPIDIEIVETSESEILSASTYGVETSEGEILSASTLGVETSEGEILSASTA